MTRCSHSKCRSKPIVIPNAEVNRLSSRTQKQIDCHPERSEGPFTNIYHTSTQQGEKTWQLEQLE